LLGKQNIAICSHCDCGPLSPDLSAKQNKSNLKAILNLLAAQGDSKIATNVKQAPGNAIYFCWKTQNKFTDIISNQIQEQVVEDIKKAGVFFNISR